MTAAPASLFVREELEPEEEAVEVFEHQALMLLADLAQRLEAIETTMSPDPLAAHQGAEPPSATST